MCKFQWIEKLCRWLRIIYCKWDRIPYFVLLLATTNPVLSAIRFQEVTGAAGIDYSGESYGASWGDFDGDALPDLWVNNHLQQPDLYHNNGDGTFTDILLNIWSGIPSDDTHGATWGDFDNDGDQDLIELVGAQGGVGQGPNHLFVNQDNVLIEMAAPLGVDYPLARGRTALWLDWNNDGLLDVLLSSNKRPDGQAPSVLFEQVAGSFQDANTVTGFDVTARSNFSQLSDLNGDGVLDLIVHGINYPQRVYDITQQPFVNLNSTLGLSPQVTNVWDAAIADFNGDLSPDIFLTRVIDGRLVSDVFQEGTTSIKARLLSRKNETGFQFRSAGSVTFALYQTPKATIFIGAQGQNPPGTSFTLSASDAGAWGIRPHIGGTDAGTYIGYDPNTQTWQLLLSTPAGDALNTVIQTVEPVTELVAIGFNPGTPPLSDRMLVHTFSGFEDQTNTAGLDAPTSCYSVVAGDFDNDMDIDLYLVCNRPTANLPNILYENLGSGIFSPVPNAGGAVGSPLGRGENAALADYDNDGFLDIFLTNGMFNDPFNNGPQQLFQNQGNINHWIEIDLEGITSNRDGIGAQVLVTAGGVTQLRERTGGVHRHAQNNKRIHFGLASNTTIDMIEIHWPSGTIQQLESIPADQILLIQEGVASLSIGNILVDERAGTATFTVKLSVPSTQTVTVSYATSDVTAFAGQDYVVQAGQLVFNPGEIRKTVVVNILPDNIDEPDETFRVTLTSAVNAAIASATATGTITQFPIWFQEVSSNAGISFVGQMIGGSWGDLNGDGCPDLWVGNHYDPPSLYLNDCNGAFSDVSTTALVGYPAGHDSHGGAWADFDNDGDQDLFEASGDDFNLLYVNKEGQLEDQANTMGVEGCTFFNDPCPLTRARTPLWLDWNHDGLLDILIAHTTTGGAPPSVLFKQNNNRFEASAASTGFDVTAPAEFARLSDLSGDGKLDLLIHGAQFPNKIYDITSIPLTDLGAITEIPIINNVQDIATADFDGDLANDIFLARAGGGGDVLQPDPNTINLVIGGKNNEKGVTFVSAGNVSFDLQPFKSASKVFIGATGIHPSTTTFTLSTTDPDAWGLQDHTPGAIDGIYIGYDPGTGIWSLLRSNVSDSGLWVQIQASEIITGMAPVNLQPFSPTKSNVLLRNTGNSFIDNSIQAGLTERANCYSVGSGDFDNDMDVDLYLVCNRPAGNVSNLLYANQGDGTFIPVPQNGGAAASTMGWGSGVAIADYDNDGFLDLFVTNSGWTPPFLGPHQLFRNTRNSNHWLEIDLEGVVSNRDGIGARILLTTPDGKTQIREQDNGVHRYSQNYQRVHFGLGNNTTIKQLLIEWPDSTSQIIENIAPDQILHVIEPVNPPLQGKPAYQFGINAGIYLWKDFFDTPYHLRVNGGGIKSVFNLKLVSTQALVQAQPIQLETSDFWQKTGYGFTLNSLVNAQDDAVDFQLANGAKALISVSQDGLSNPRQVHVGSTGSPLSPAGFIQRVDSLPPRPDFVVGEDLGLFFGRGLLPNSVEARLSGDGPRRMAGISLISSTPLVNVTPLSLELDDVLLQPSPNSVYIDGWLGPKWDGVDISLAGDSNIGFAYRQDGLLSPDNISSQPTLGATAYWLPLAEPYGAPDYDPVLDEGLFLWKDNGGKWHLRATAGTSRQYVGRLISDTPLLTVEPFDLEFSWGDVLDSSDPTQIAFVMNVVNSRQDGFDFEFPAGASVRFELDKPAIEAAKLVRIGQNQWPVNALPLDLTGW